MIEIQLIVKQQFYKNHPQNDNQLKRAYLKGMIQPPIYIKPELYLRAL